MPDEPLHTSETPDQDLLIDRYLDASMSPAEREAFEARMLAEPALRERVDMQRWMQRELGDTQKRAFIDTLASISEDYREAETPPAVVKPLFQRLAPWGIAVAAAIALLLILFLDPSTPEPGEAPLAKEQVDTLTQPEKAPLAEVDPDSMQESTDSPAPKVIPAPPKPQLATRNEADFAPHPYLDPLVQRNVRAADFQVEGQATYAANMLSISGTLSEVSETPQALGVFLYSNKEADYLDGNYLTVEEITLNADPEQAGVFTFSQTIAVSLSPGRYYYFLADLEEEEPIWVGRLDVRH